jgi:hypothetical protein
VTNIFMETPQSNRLLKFKTKCFGMKRGMYNCSLQNHFTDFKSWVEFDIDEIERWYYIDDIYARLKKRYRKQGYMKAWTEYKKFSVYAENHFEDNYNKMFNIKEYNNWYESNIKGIYKHINETDYYR